MRHKATKYLPMFPRESKQAYERRLLSSFLPGYYREALDMHTSKVFSEPLRIDDSFPEEFKDNWFTDMDLLGSSLDAWAADVYEEGHHAGVCHVFVDLTSVPGSNPTRADAMRAGQRPYCTIIPAQDLIGWRYEKDSRGYRLTQIRYRTEKLVPDGEYDVRHAEVVRVVEPGQWQEWEMVVDSKSGESSWRLETDWQEFSYPGIPLVTFYDNAAGFMRARPSLEELAYKELEAWQSASDQRNALKFARIPFYHFSGFSEADIKKMGAIASSRYLRSSNADATADVVETSGKPIELGERDLERIRNEAMVLARRPLIADKPRTATETVIDTGLGESPLQRSALRFQSFLEELVWTMAEVAGVAIPASAEYPKLVTDDAVQRETSDKAKLIADLWVEGKVDNKNAANELQLLNFFSDSFDWSEFERFHSEQEMKGGNLRQIAAGNPLTPFPAPVPEVPEQQTEQEAR